MTLGPFIWAELCPRHNNEVLMQDSAEPRFQRLVAHQASQWLSLAQTQHTTYTRTTVQRIASHAIHKSPTPRRADKILASELYQTLNRVTASWRPVNEPKIAMLERQWH